MKVNRLGAMKKKYSQPTILEYGDSFSAYADACGGGSSASGTCMNGTVIGTAISGFCEQGGTFGSCTWGAKPNDCVFGGSPAPYPV